MIRHLIRTEIIGNLNILSGLIAVNLVGLLIFIFATQMQEIAPAIVFSIIPAGIAAFAIYTRAKRERRSRLHAQLPVTQLQIVISEWCFAFITLLIPASILLLSALLSNEYSFIEALRNFFVIFCAITSVLAAIAIAMGIGKLPRPYSRVLEWLWILFVLFFIALAPISLDSRSFFFSAAGIPNWTLISTFYGVSAVGLVAVNIWLHQKAEDYLGN